MISRSRRDHHRTSPLNRSEHPPDQDTTAYDNKIANSGAACREPTIGLPPAQATSPHAARETRIHCVTAASAMMTWMMTAAARAAGTGRSFLRVDQHDRFAVSAPMRMFWRRAAARGWRRRSVAQPRRQRPAVRIAGCKRHFGRRRLQSRSKSAGSRRATLAGRIARAADASRPRARRCQPGTPHADESARGLGSVWSTTTPEPRMTGD